MASWMRAQGAAQKATLIDGTSATGRAYGAKTTPHMFVVDPSGKLVYNGAIDDKRSSNPADVKDAPTTTCARRSPKRPRASRSPSRSTSPYGCSVKY